MGMKHLCDFLKLNSNFQTILLWQHNFGLCKSKTRTQTLADNTKEH